MKQTVVCYENSLLRMVILTLCMLSLALFKHMYGKCMRSISLVPPMSKCVLISQVFTVVGFW